jgi:aldehyde dehydrogenase (NAD+)
MNFIGGCWSPASDGQTYPNVNPMRPAEPAGEFAASTPADVAASLDAAVAASPEWAAFPLARRASYLAAAADALEARGDRVAVDMATEMGKPLREARGETLRAVQILRYAAGAAERAVGERFEQQASGGDVYTARRPVGVVALITPWNFPIAIPTWKLAPALVYGNTVVLKLALESPRTGLHLAEAFEDADLPAGVLNVITGRGSVIGPPLVRDPRVAAVSFTGSIEVGHGIRELAAARGARVQLELGGQNPLIVMADADLDRAAEAAYAGAFYSAGQKCTATRRIYVQSEVYERFRAQLLRRIGRGVVGDPLDPDVEVGPVVNASQFESILAAIELGKREGGTVAVGGTQHGSMGYVIAPTLFEGVVDDAFLSREEVFGPVTSLYRFESFDEAIERANAVRFGLSGAIFTSSLTHATRFLRVMQAGLLHVNSQTAGADVHVPFGGIRSSGFGPHEQGQAALEFYTDLVTAYVDI